MPMKHGQTNPNDYVCFISDDVTNEDVLRRSNVQCPQDKVSEGRLWWMIDIQWTPLNGPQVTWRSILKKDFSVSNLDWDTVAKEAVDRLLL